MCDVFIFSFRKFLKMINLLIRYKLSFYLLANLSGRPLKRRDFCRYLLPFMGKLIKKYTNCARNVLKRTVASILELLSSRTVYI